LPLLHLAQWALNENNFSSAADYLRRAERLIQRGWQSNGIVDPESAAVRARGITWQQQVHETRRNHIRAGIHSSIICLQAVATFRQDPSSPQYAVNIVEEGLRLYPKATMLLISGGEVLAQGGDMVQALKLFKRCSEVDSTLPLSYVSAGRVYRQLGQLQAAEAHFLHALSLDPGLALTLVDLSQLQRQRGQVVEAVQTIEQAMVCARQVSEIKDILAARYLARLQQSVGEKHGLLIVPAISCEK
jgi:tetratricopeptide (TPR) repeat protein